MAEVNETGVTSQVAAAEAIIVDVLLGGAAQPFGLRAEAGRRGVQISRRAWKAAKKRVGVESFKDGGIWYWRFPDRAVVDRFGPTLEVELAAWLQSPQGRFAAYLAQRDREGPPPGTQLELLDDGSELA